MSKRRNESGQMRREEYEAAVDDVGTDTFEIGIQRASDESIRKRKIVKARVGNRLLPTTSKATAATEATTEKNKPFEGFQGLTTTKSPATSNPFADFSGLTGSSNKSEVKIVSGSNSVAAGSYQQAMEELNKAFMSFVNGEAQKYPSASWNSSVQEYLKYAEEIATKHASTKPVAINDTKCAFPSPFSLNSTSAPATSSVAPLSFAMESDEKTTPAFSFGALPKPAASVSSTPATKFSFGTMTSSSLSSNAPGGLSFGTVASSASIPIPTASGDENEENIGREEATVIIKADSSDEDCKFEAEKTKIYEFKKAEKRWADKGVHPLKILVNKKTNSSRILVRNEIGKIVLNAALYKGIAVRPHEVKGKTTGVTLALQVNDGELTQYLLKVNAARVNEFIKALESAATQA
ncbi:Ran-binding protein RANBP3 [Plasmopara halstedii]|uniref:Ran-binding protein RANBP3 n=1 Tax=Plasmopara halstedii TaxID=4781 RepID=A0A0P1AJL6_PLAHL|nr:Ran-binding protein RANBP3 [Plasmopara halstedii]CEG40986.1 Ran-binding protein RANBP3 [Plasmopara halstedii]|eukprot:XP_024577355.1 Ran-binding protein RANBP3 [Plasmopara halstedii]